MRRLVWIPLAAALVLASAASATLQPVKRSFGELTIPRLRAGAVRVPAAQSKGRVTVLVDLALPPLAAHAGRGLYATGGVRKLSVTSSSSRAYLARLARAQQAAAATLRRAIPSVRISERYRLLLDGFAVSVPARSLPRLARLSVVRKIYPSVRYQLTLNRSPSLIGADTYWARTGNRGEGVKIGVVDDGVDETNPFFNPAGFSYPAGFPKGGTRWTTPKVIVARSFPGPGSGREGRIALDRKTSFHGTHVAGIAAGDSGTTATAGPDHPTVPGLSGVAPRAWIGNYRVFNTPTPTGYDAFTPQIVAAFESAVADGMDVINFSGGGPQADPTSDALVEVVHNVANAGVVPVIAAGNDRDDFGLGSVGSPGTAADAISVAAVSNTHVFAPALSITNADAPANLKQIPFESVDKAPDAWTSSDHTLVDVGTVVGNDGKPVERHLCGPPDDPNGSQSSLLKHSLDGAVALVSRGTCSFFSKALRVHDAGGIGMIVVDNREGEANQIPLRLADFPLGMVSNLDGAQLRDYLVAHGGRAPFRISSDVQQIETGRSGIITSFSSAGPTDFGHQLKPDVSAPGGQILSSTLTEFAGAPFAVFDGTSMATPHVAGAAALLVQHHRDWSPIEVKSALMSTAGPAWGNSARTVEAPVLLEGSGLINVDRADDPMLFTDPVSLSFGDLNVLRSSARRALLLSIADAGDGAGTWSVSVQPQSASPGATIDVPSSISIAPGGSTDIGATAHAPQGATAGDNYGFIVLTQGSVTRRVPYYFAVTQPGLALDPAAPLKKFEAGDTLTGTSHANRYRFPSSPFGPPPDYTGPPMDQSGAEHVYVTHVNQPVANIGVAIVGQTANTLVDPWFLGSQDENDVQGYPGTPINVNALTPGYQADVGAAGAIFPREKRYYVSVDSGRDLFTGTPLAGKYVLRSWLNDVTPPRIRFLTTRVTAGRPLLAARVTDAGSGVDPLSLVIGYRKVLVGAAFYDRASGLALFPLPRAAPALRRGRTAAIVQASDFQETKNIDQQGDILPNTGFRALQLSVVARPTVTWIVPTSGACTRKGSTLAVAAAAPKRISSVRFFDGKRPIATIRRGGLGIYSTAWRKGKFRVGGHLLHAVVHAGRATASARLAVRVCR